MAVPKRTPQAARELSVSASTIRRWISRGAPTVSLGKEGRGNGSLVDVDQLRAWRAGVTVQRGDNAVLNAIAVGIKRVFSDHAPGHGQPAHKVVGLSDRLGAAFLAHVYYAVGKQVLGREPEDVPAEISDLERISQTAHK